MSLFNLPIILDTQLPLMTTTATSSSCCVLFTPVFHRLFRCSAYNIYTTLLYVQEDSGTAWRADVRAPCVLSSAFEQLADLAEKIRAKKAAVETTDALAAGDKEVCIHGGCLFADRESNVVIPLWWTSRIASL